jgi:uncharacterized repeat protein (TIGR01451 family)
MKKLLLLTFLVATMCLYGPAAWSIQDYPFSFTDGVGENATLQCPFTNGFDIRLVSGIASEETNNGAINVTVQVDGTVGNGNADPDSFQNDKGWCTDTDPLVDCGDPGGTTETCQYEDAPGGPGTTATNEAYTIQICQPGTVNIGCTNGTLAEVIFQPANLGGNNVFSNTAGVTVDPTNIPAVNGKKTFTITVSGLSGVGLNFRSQWGIKVKAGSEVDGPGEDEAGTIVTPPAPPALSCQKSFNVSSAEPGQEVTATVTAQNSGASDTLITIVDTIDVGFSYVAGSGSAGEPSIAGQVLTWSGLNLPAGGSVVITYRLRIDALAEGQTICNNAFVNSIDFPGVTAGPCLACVTRPIVQKEPVPGMTEFTIALTALLLILATVFFIRRRRTHNS